MKQDMYKMDPGQSNQSQESEQDKYTMEPGQSSLSQQKVKEFQSKMIFEQKKIKMHKSCIIND